MYILYSLVASFFLLLCQNAFSVVFNPTTWQIHKSMAEPFSKIRSSKSNHPTWKGKHDLKVIGAGFSRTGSYSLKMALEMLGFTPCWHIIDVMADDDKATALMWWKDIDQKLNTDKQSVDFDEFYSKLAHNAQAAVDWPTSFYWEELAEYYPNCKIILTVRDNRERWYQSCIRGFNLYFYNPLLRLLVFSRLIDLIHMVATQLVPKSVEEFGGIDTFYNDKQSVFDQANKRIHRMSNDERYKHRTLIFKVTDGWQPLCEFLGKDIPQDIAFPRSNDGKALARNTSNYMWKRIQQLVLNPTFLMILCVIIAILMFRTVVL
eukprot:966882_1